MLVELPAALRAAVEQELSRSDPRRLVSRARELSERYRAHAASGRARFVSDPDDARAYAALILPQSFAQLVGALRMLPLRCGDWSPRSLLDLGAGPGTSAWAAASVWPELESVVHCEADAAFLELGMRLSASSSSEAVRAASWDERDLVEEGLPKGEHDLVILSLVLSEMAVRERREVLHAAWRRCRGVLVVVEPGTPATFEVVREARAQLLRGGAHAIAPCPGDGACPMGEGDWCHFAERSQRPEFQRRVKDASLPWEDAKFSFAALARFPSAAAPWARVLHAPRVLKGRIELSLCTDEGLVDEAVTKSRKAGWRAAKRLAWGAAVESEGLIERG